MRTRCAQNVHKMCILCTFIAHDYRVVERQVNAARVGRRDKKKKARKRRIPTSSQTYIPTLVYTRFGCDTDRQSPLGLGGFHRCLLSARLCEATTYHCCGRSMVCSRLSKCPANKGCWHARLTCMYIMIAFLTLWVLHISAITIRSQHRRTVLATARQPNARNDRCP
jgi:hypothetical protein